MFRRVAAHNPFRRDLLDSCTATFNGNILDSHTYTYDVLSRPTARTSGGITSSFAYNERGEVVSAQIGANRFTHAYDFIGNQTNFVANAVTNTYTHNALNQIETAAIPPLYTLNSPLSISHDLDGNLTNDCVFAYAYDAANRLASVTSASLTNGAVRVVNAYDYRNRRTRKTVQRYADGSWHTTECRTFVYDGWNLIHETVSTVSGATTNTTEIQYFWGMDLSETLQGAGGVGGLLAVSINGLFYFPSYDNNGNVTKYIDESGNVVAAYEYDDFGRTISQSGSMANFFHIRFSTKYYDSETRLCYYGERFYAPDWRVWLNRDLIWEEGGLNLYCYCQNNSVKYFDAIGEKVNQPPVDAFFRDVKGRLPVRIAKYVSVVLRDLKKMASGMYHYRVAFIARFTPPPDVDSRRIKQSGLSKLLFGDANGALGGEKGMYTQQKGNGDIPTEAWGAVDASNYGTGGIHYRYNTKSFQFGYFVYRQSNGKGQYLPIDHNSDMYTSWSVGGAMRLLPSQDISVSGDMNKCDEVQIHYGDRGFNPYVLKIRPNY